MSTPKASPAAPTATADTTDRIRAAILSAARHLLGTGGPYEGDVLVRIVAPGKGIECRVKPTATASGLEADPIALAGADAMLLSRIKQLESRIKQLENHLLSPAERLLLRTLSELEPCSASAVQDAVRAEVKKSDFWSIWGQLQHRQLVHQRDDKLYTLAVDWVRELIGEQ
jgi:hypothetical protein